MLLLLLLWIKSDINSAWKEKEEGKSENPLG